MTEQPMPEEIMAVAFFLGHQAGGGNGKVYVNRGFWDQGQAGGYPRARAVGGAGGGVAGTPLGEVRRDRAVLAIRLLTKAAGRCAQTAPRSLR